MAEVARRRATYAEYVAIANDSELKYEYISGEVVAMAGGTVAHARLISRVSSALDRALDRLRRLIGLEYVRRTGAVASAYAPRGPPG